MSITMSILVSIVLFLLAVLTCLAARFEVSEMHHKKNPTIWKWMLIIAWCTIGIIILSSLECLLWTRAAQHISGFRFSVTSIIFVITYCYLYVYKNILWIDRIIMGIDDTVPYGQNSPV